MSRPNVAGRRPSPGAARRWPDLMIGVLVLLLLGGFGALLLRDNGPSGTVTAATETETATPVAEAEIPSAPGTDGGVTPASEPTEAATMPTTPPAPTEPEASTTAETPAPSASGNTAPAESAPAAPAPTTEPVAAAPLQPAPTPAEPEKSEVPSAATLPEQPAAPVTPSTSLTPANPEPAATTEIPVPAATAPATQAAAVPAVEQRTPLRSDYRISLGSFATEQTVRSQTAGVSGLGYTVHPIDLGGQFVAQVGPYADEATARRALADIRRAFPSAVLYPPRGVSLKGDTAPAAPASTTQTPAGQAPAAQPPAVQPPAPVPGNNAAATTPAPPLPVPTTPAPTETPAASSPTYLQVGAFDRVESAQTLVEQLRSQGFTPSVNAPEGRKVTVLVGPFSGTALTDAESKLSSAGHDSFRVR